MLAVQNFIWGKTFAAAIIMIAALVLPLVVISQPKADIGLQMVLGLRSGDFKAKTLGHLSDTKWPRGGMFGKAKR
jgi:uncharacterized membrane protein